MDTWRKWCIAAVLCVAPLVAAYFEDCDHVVNLIGNEGTVVLNPGKFRTIFGRNSYAGYFKPNSSCRYRIRAPSHYGIQLVCDIDIAVTVSGVGRTAPSRFSHQHMFHAVRLWYIYIFDNFDLILKWKCTMRRCVDRARMDRVVMNNFVYWWMAPRTWQIVATFSVAPDVLPVLRAWVRWHLVDDVCQLQSSFDKYKLNNFLISIFLPCRVYIERSRRPIPLYRNRHCDWLTTMNTNWIGYFIYFFYRNRCEFIDLF